MEFIRKIQNDIREFEKALTKISGELPKQEAIIAALHKDRESLMRDIDALDASRKDKQAEIDAYEFSVKARAEALFQSAENTKAAAMAMYDKQVMDSKHQTKRLGEAESMFKAAESLLKQRQEEYENLQKRIAQVKSIAG